MKTLRLFFLMSILAIIAISCDKDDDTTNDPVELISKLDGLYVYGSNTVAETSVDPNAKMSRALLNPDKSNGNENLEGIYAKLMHIGAGGTIEFLNIVNEVATHYGIANNGQQDSATVYGDSDISNQMIHGTLVEDEAAITIANEGLYYVYVDMNSMNFRVLQLTAQMIGDATEAQWSAGTSLPMTFSSVDSTVFEATELPLVGASGYRYRFFDGWEVVNNGDMATYTHLGVESYGDAWDSGINDIGYYKDNIPHKEDGTFTVHLKYDASTGEWEETKIKTGGILIDYSYTSMGLFGNAYTLPSGDTAAWGSGTDGYELHTPEKSGAVYTWTWDNADLIQDREFIFLENGAWGGLQLDWSMITSVEGQAIDDGHIVDATTLGGEYHNFYVVQGGSYNVSLIIDAEAETKVVTITSN